MFREEYRKANDAISAPKTLLASIREQAEADAAPSLLDSFERPKRVWPRVLGYSGAAVAAAALALLIVRPFGLFENSRNASSSTPMLAESKAYDMEAAAAVEMSDGMMLTTTMTASAAESAPAYAAGILGDGDTEMDDYYEEYALPDPTYADVWAALYPTGSTNEIPSAEGDAGAGALKSEASDIALPEGYSLCATIESDDRIFVIAQADGITTLLVYDEAMNLLGEASTAGSFVGYELRDTTLFSDEGALEMHRALLLETTWSPDLSIAHEDEPASYCPSVTDPSGTRMLQPEEITIIDFGDRYAVYTAVAWDDGVRVLYAFAELGLA